VLAHLVLRANQVVPAERLIDALWGEDLPDDPRATLRVYISRLRSALGQNAIEGRRPGYLLHAEPEEVDAFRFERLLREASRGAVDPRLTVGTLDEAIELWRGPALADLATESSLSGEIARLDELHLQAVEARITAQLALGRHADVIAELEALTAAQPLRERVWGLLILALYRSGRQADALTTYERARQLLADELGIDPTPDLRMLQEQILRHDSALDLDGRPLRGYRLLEKIGEGSFAVVHRAIQPHVGREVAVKAITRELANHPGFVRRFESEAQIIARLENPHIVPLYDYWRDPDGAYLVMRYLSGGSLRRRLDEEGWLAPDEVAEVVDHVTRALSTAHRQGIVHRDVRPENVLLDGEGNAYLADFGIAADVANELATKTGSRRTSVYLAPEQIRREPVSPRTDVYALGVVVYEALTGRRPSVEVSIATLPHEDLHDSFPSVWVTRPRLPRPVHEVLARATADDPTARFDDVAAFASAFRGAIGPVDGIVEVEMDRPNPFKGLRPFVEADAEDFFGREVLVERLVGRLGEDVEDSRFLAVVGPSGSGKSSAVSAGLVPALRRGALDGSAGWFYVGMAPGAHPLEELETALLRVAVRAPASLLELLQGGELGFDHAVRQVLPDDGSQLVLVVDQLEEVFTLVEQERERRQFLDSIRTAVVRPGSRVVVIATLRADFYDRPLAYRGFAELFRGRTEPIVPLSPDELERAIAGPAENVGVSVEPALVAQVVANVAEQPGALPLLQYAMTEVFEARSDGVLSAQTYREIGGVSGALARRAEQLFDGLNANGKQAAEQLFLHLVALGEGNDVTRRRVSRSELDRIGLDGRELDGVVEAYGRHRLLSLDRDPDTREPTVEVAHEALLREWTRMRGWIDAAREDLRAERRLAVAADEWRATGQDPSFLLRGARLEQVSAWVGSTSLALAWTERQYLNESVEVADAERTAEAERVDRERRLERRSVRRLRTAVAVFAIAALVAAGLTVVATRQGQRAEAQARVASARELAAAAVANIENDSQLSVLLAIEAVERTRSADGTVVREAEEALHRAVTASRIVTSIPGSHHVNLIAEEGGAIDWGPDGLVVMEGVFASEGPRPVGVIDLRDEATGDIVRSIGGHAAELTGAEFSPDGAMLATTGMDAQLMLWDPSSGTRLRSVRGPAADACGPSFSGDGSHVAACFRSFDEPEGVVRVLDLDTDRVSTFPAPPWVNDVATSPNGRWVLAVSGYSGGVMHLIDVQTGDVRRIPTPLAFGLTSVAWSPDGRHVAAGGFGSSVVVIDPKGRLEQELRGHSGEAHFVDWAPDGSRLLTGSSDGTAKVWEMSGEGAEVLTLSTRAGGINGVAFSPDGNRVLTRSETKVMDVWDVGTIGDAEIANIPDVDQVVNLTSDRITTSDQGGSLTTTSLDTGDRSYRSVEWFDPPTELYSGYDFAPDGGAILVVPDRGPTTVRDVETGAVLFESSAVADWSSDGRLASIDLESDSVKIVDRSGRQVGALEGPDLSLDEVIAFGPRDLVAFDESGETWIWNWSRDEVIARLPVRLAQVARFDPDGRTLAVGGPETTIWDTRTGRLLLTLPSSPSLPGDLAFSPDSSRLAEMDGDGIVRLFDTASGEEVLVLHGHTSGRQIVFSPDGSMLATHGDDIVRIWALDIDDLLEIADENVTRSLTDEECRRYIHVASCPPVRSVAR
jgi:WD40 repeat protein/DNA-binding SARP family transcriptional activator